MPFRTLFLLVVFAAAAVGGCSAVPSAPTAQQRTEAAAATLLAVAAAPDATDADFAPLVVPRLDGVRGMADHLRRTVADVSGAGRFRYTVEAFGTQDESEGTWHSLTIRFQDPGQTRVLLTFLSADGRLMLDHVE